MENELKKREKQFIVILAIALLALSFIPFLTAFTPAGASNVTEVRTERASEDPASNHSAFAGNLTELIIFGYSSTQAWQGYFGNVSGTIQLAYGDAAGDGNPHVFYNWSLANAQGQVYASTNSSIEWDYIQCFNHTSTGSYDEEYSAAKAENLTSLYGRNMSGLESEFGILWDDVDGVNETFVFYEHQTIYVVSKNFTNICPTTRIYGSTGAGVQGEFEQLLMYEPVSESVIFTAILHENGVVGFDGGTYDFQMMVLEDGHGTDIDTTTYYFFVDLK
jgi:hypothetical protein